MAIKSNAQTSICIVGAGPAGSTTALFLNKHGIPCTLLDRAVFPRDKMCGESFDGQVTHTLNRLNPDLLKKLQGLVLECRKYSLVNSQSKRVTVEFPPTATPRLLGRRIDFDNFLVEEVRKSEHINFLEGTAMKDLTRTADGWELHIEKDGQINCNLLIWAIGASSPLSSNLRTIKHRPKDEFLFVRGYYRNISTPETTPMVEIFFVKKPVPLCFCLCPVGGGLANVEIGINKIKAQKHQLNIRALLQETINQHPELNQRFKYATPEGSIKGASMLLPSAWPQYSGDGFLLVGDAASSINPVTGYGVGHAMAQGRLAADTAIKSLLNQDTTADFLRQYDMAIKKTLGREISLGRAFTAAMGFIPLLDKMIALYGIQDLMRRLLSDTNFAEKIMRPFAWR